MSEPNVEKESNVEKEPGPQGETPATETSSNDVPEKRKREYKDFGHETEKPTRMFTFALSPRPFSLIYASRLDANVDMSQVCILATLMSVI
jgi:hypothetical protein